MAKISETLARLASPGMDGATVGEVRFFSVGFHVMVRTSTGEGPWCMVEPQHNTTEARWTAELRARLTAAALNEMYAEVAKHAAP